MSETKELELNLFAELNLKLVEIGDVSRRYPSLLENQLTPLPNSKAEEVILYELQPLREAD